MVAGACRNNRFEQKAVEDTINKAVVNAKHGSLFKRQKVAFKALKPTLASYVYTPKENPFIMDSDEKIAYFANIASMLTKNEKIVYSNVTASFHRQYKIYANTEGTFTDSLIYDVFPAMMVMASDGRQNYSRKWPGDMNARRGGFEKVRAFEFEQNTDRIIKEAIDLLTAPTIEEKRADLIIGGGHLALQLHESAGHATEADRIFGMEISYAGKTFIKPKMLGKYQYGSDNVNI